MKLDYGTLLSPSPIKLSIGTLRKPKLIEISEIGFDKFNSFECFMKMTPELYYTKICGEQGEAYWKSLTEDEQENIDLYSLIIKEESLQKIYVDILDYFFLEPVIFKEDMFILLKHGVENEDDITPDDVNGVIHENTFLQVLKFLQQICCIYEHEETLDEVKYKNNLARKLYEKILKAKKKEQKSKKADINLSLPNIISAVSNYHPSITPVNVWDLTVFTLLDSFNRLQVNSMFRIDCTRVSVWGDEKKTFDAALWYKNNFDKK